MVSAAKFQSVLRRITVTWVAGGASKLTDFGWRNADNVDSCRARMRRIKSYLSGKINIRRVFLFFVFVFFFCYFSEY